MDWQVLFKTWESNSLAENIQVLIGQLHFIVFKRSKVKAVLHSTLYIFYWNRQTLVKLKQYHMEVLLSNFRVNGHTPQWHLLRHM